jgi:hypothetical protein
LGQVVADHIQELQVDARYGVHDPRATELIERIIGFGRPIPESSPLAVGSFQSLISVLPSSIEK